MSNRRNHAYGRVLIRERINKILEGILEYPLFVVAAPMGYGKTIAVREFLRIKKTKHVWVSLIAFDGTMLYFWDRLTTQLELLNKNLGEQLKHLDFPTNATQIAKVLEIISEYKYDEATVIVIDDFHLTACPESIKLLNFIVKANIPNLYIVLIMRDVTNLRFAELGSLCYTMTLQSLKFEEDEIKQYFKFMKYTPSPEVVEKVARYTGGWISMIYLIMIGLQKGLPVGISSTIDELVETNLYEPYDELTKQLLQKLAIMESFTAEQAAFVLEQPDIVLTLKRLYKENAFIDYDEATGVFKIHNILLDFLRRKQNFQEEKFRELNKRIGEWYLNQHQYMVAYGYLYQTRETEYILKLLNNEENVTNALAEFEGFREMFRSTPREILFKYPIAYLQYICLMLLTGDHESQQDGIQRLEELEQHFLAKTTNIHPAYKNRILGEIQILRIFVVFNDAKKMIEHKNKALELLEGKKSSLMMRESEFTFGSPHFLYSYFREQGKLRETVEMMVEGFPSFAELSDGCGTGCEYVTLAEYALETGDFHGAELNACKAVYKAKTKNQVSISICAHFTLVRLYILHGKIQKGLELLARVKKNIQKECNPILNTALDLFEGYVYGCLGQLHKIPVWLQKGDISEKSFLYQGMAFNYIVYGKAVLLSKNYLELEILTESFQPYFAVYNNQLGFIHNYIHEAAAKYKQYGMGPGKESLAKAIALGQADNIIMPFAENAVYILEMLESFAKEESQNKYLKQILTVCGMYMESLKTLKQIFPALSEREKEVLLLLSEGFTRDEIASKLSVSSGTVKTHLQNIYQKLEAKGKIAAIKKAEKLKLL